MSSPYLENVHVDHFGAWHDKNIGPFGRHLNIVFGRNEAGKTTFASFVKGVLFGWERASKDHNNYEPDGAERSGKLVFVDTPDTPSAQGAPNTFLELRRAKNAEGLQGDSSLSNDIEKETYSTIFSLTSDQLMDLDNEDTVTSSLLTAGSGTTVSPAKVRDDLDDRIASFTSRSEKVPQSLIRLKQQEDETHKAIEQAEIKEKQYRKDRRAFQELEPRRKELGEREDDLNKKINNLKRCRSELKNIQLDKAEAETTIKNAREAEQNAQQQQLDHKEKCSPSQQALTDADDRLLRSRIDDIADRKSRLKALLDAARESSNNARASYEVLKEAQEASSKDNDTSSQGAHRQMLRVLQLVILTVIFIVLLVFGILLFASGAETSSLSYMALGVVLIAFAVALAVAVLFLFLRSNRESKESHDSEEDNKTRLEQALQDALREEKKLEAYEADMQKLENEITVEFKEMGLEEAGSSPSLAREILENAKEMREQMDRAHKNELEAANTAQEALLLRDELIQQEEYLRMEAGISPDETIDDIDRKITELEDQLRSAREEYSSIDVQWGELNKELEQALKSHDLDNLKNAEQDFRTQRREATYDLARLLLAQAMLNSAIKTWEEESQPAVYVEASRLFSLMTDGQWTRITRRDDGTFEVLDAFHNTRSVTKLSTGTRQQLYLSIRIALLMCADNVGRSIPVIADDILVNFDAQRRVGAAKALAELAGTRQVIVLTCHEEVVEVLQSACEDATVIDLN